MTLVDTSVWVDHFRNHDAHLATELQRGAVVCHPFVRGELALGVLRRRQEVLSLLSELPEAGVVDDDEAMAFVEQHRLAGAGIGWVDVHLLASAILGGLPLWTRDRRLEGVARRLGVSARR